MLYSEIFKTNKPKKTKIAIFGEVDELEPITYGANYTLHPYTFTKSSFFHPSLPILIVNPLYFKSSVNVALSSNYSIK